MTESRDTIPPLYQKYSTPFLLLAILFLIGLAYSNTLNSPPVLDDRAAFINNQEVYIDNFSVTSLKQLATTKFGLTRFLPMLSFAADHLIGQGDIAQFHKTNIAIHLLTTVALYLLLLGLTRTNPGARSLRIVSPACFSLIAASLWALHPIQTNTVTYLVQRMASLAALFYIASLAGYVWARMSKTGPIRIFAWSVFCLATLGAFLSKENSATLPVAVLMIELFFLRPDSGRSLLRKFHWYHWLLLVIAIVLTLPFVATKISGIANNYVASGRHFNMTERLLTELRVVVFYLSLLALPLPGRLNLDHDFPISHTLWNPTATILALVLLIILLVSAFRHRRHNPLAAFGLLFFFLNLLIESSVIPLELVFEHRLYLPSIGFFIAAVAFCDWACRLAPIPDPSELTKIFLLSMIVLGCGLMITTSFRNNVWRDQLTLYTDIAVKSPLKPRAQVNLGLALMKVERQEEALAAFQKAIFLGQGQSEEYIKAANNIVSIFVSQNNFQEAADWTERLLIDRPEVNMNFDGFPLLMTNLAVSYWKLGRFNDSLEAFSLGLKIHHRQHTPLLLGGLEAMLLDASTVEEGRRQLDLQNNGQAIQRKIAWLLLADKDYKNTLVYLTKALAIEPSDPATISLKEIFDEEVAKNQRATQIITTERLLAIKTSLRVRSILYLVKFIENHYRLLTTLIGPLLESANRLAPESPNVALALAQWHGQHGKIDTALKITETLLAQRPNSPNVLELNGRYHFILGQQKEAAAVFSKLLDIYPGHPRWENYTKIIWEIQKTGESN